MRQLLQIPRKGVGAHTLRILWDQQTKPGRVDETRSRRFVEDTGTVVGQWHGASAPPAGQLFVGTYAMLLPPRTVRSPTPLP
jgi:hypothetical protein